MINFKTLLRKAHENLNILQQREARYGGNTPLELLNQIEDYEIAIPLIKQKIDGEISEAELREALKPLANFQELRSLLVSNECLDDSINQEAKIELDRQQDAVLREYLDWIAELLRHELREPDPDEKVKAVVRTRTVVTLLQLDGRRNETLLRFLDEAKIINKDKPIIHFRAANLSKLDLNQAVLPAIDLSGANLAGANLRGANLMSANLRGAHLREADLAGALLWRANLMEAILEEANLWRAALIEANLMKANLFFANLKEAHLKEANLTRANLWRADLSGADLARANLMEVVLVEANLTRANFTGAVLVEAHLTEANLTGAALAGTNLEGTNLTRANLMGANLMGTNLADTNLTNANLTKVQYDKDTTTWPVGFDPKKAGAKLVE